MRDEIARHLRAHSVGAGPNARAGAAAFIHRFGSALNLHTHSHVCAIDGVFEPDANREVRFIVTRELDAQDAEAVQTRILRAWQRRREEDSRVIFLDKERVPGDPLAQPEPVDEFDQPVTW